MSASAQPPRLALVLALLATLGPYTIDAFFPSMRAMAAEFGISYWQVQQTLTVYLVPYACMSLVHGSLADAIGRRRVVLAGLLFYALASAGCALALLVLRKLPETLPVAARAPLQFGPLLGNMLGIARHAEFLLLTAASGLCFVAMQIYIGSAPAIILDHWGGTETGFAMLMVPIVSGYALGALASGQLAGRLPPSRQANYGYTLVLATTGAMLALQTLMAHPPVLAQQLLLACTAFGLQLLFPIITLRILDLFAQSRGAATAANTFVLLLLAALMMGVLAPWLSASMQRLAFTAFVFNSAGWCVWRYARHYQRRLAVL